MTTLTFFYRVCLSSFLAAVSSGSAHDAGVQNAVADAKLVMSKVMGAHCDLDKLYQGDGSVVCNLPIENILKNVATCQISSNFNIIPLDGTNIDHQYVQNVNGITITATDAMYNWKLVRKASKSNMFKLQMVNLFVGKPVP